MVPSATLAAAAGWHRDARAWGLPSIVPTPRRRLERAPSACWGKANRVSRPAAPGH